METSPSSVTKATQALLSPRDVMREGHRRLESVCQNVDAIDRAETLRSRRKLLTYSSERVYTDLLTNSPWSDCRQGVLDKPEYIFGDNKIVMIASGHVTFSFINSQREIVVVVIYSL